MKVSLSVLVIVFVGVCSAYPHDVEQLQQNIERMGENQEFLDGRSDTWDALRNWFRPATTYVREKLPEMTPTELATEIRDRAVVLRDQARDHPVVQTIGTAVKPVRTWISDTAGTLSKTSFRDMFNNVADSVRGVDKTVGSWISSASDSQKNGDIEILER